MKWPPAHLCSTILNLLQAAGLMLPELKENIFINKAKCVMQLGNHPREDPLLLGLGLLLT